MSQKQDLDRPLFDQVSEQNLASAIINDPDRYVPELREAGITDAHFIDDYSKRIWRTLSESYDAGYSAEAENLAERVLQSGQADAREFSCAIMDIRTLFTGSAESIAQHTRKVIEMRAKRIAYRDTKRLMDTVVDGDVEGVTAAIQALTGNFSKASEKVSNTTPSSVSFIHPADLDMAEIEPDDLVENALGQGVMSCIYAPPGSGKTFVALDLGAHVATGKPWHGREVEQGAVLYIGLEGKSGVKRRIKALKKEGIINNDSPLIASPSSIDLLSPSSIMQWITAIKRDLVKQGHDIKLIIIDTLLRAMAGGNVSDSQDMSQAVEHGLQIVEEIGCTVLLIHHTGKDVTKKELGSIALRAGLDSSIFVEKSAGGIISVKPDKQKDMADGEEMNLYFSLNVVEVGSTAKGKVLTSCTLTPEDNPGNEQGARAMQEIEWNKMNMLDLLQEEGELRTTEWDSLCRERHGLTKGKVETYRRELVDSGEVTHRRDGITHYYSRPIAIPKIA